MKDNRSVFVWAILVSLAVSLMVNFKLARNMAVLSSRVERLNTVDSFRALEDSLIGKYIDLQNLLTSRNYGEHVNMEDPRKFLKGRLPLLLFLFSSYSCQICVRKSGQICAEIDSFSQRKIVQAFAVGSGLSLDNVLGYAKLGQLRVPLFWDRDGEIYANLKIPEENVYVMLIAPTGEVVRALVFDHSEQITYHEKKFLQSVLDMLSTKFEEGR